MIQPSNTNVPDDAVPHIPVGEIRLSVYGSEDVRAVIVRAVDGKVPLTIGELVEFEIVGIERTVTER